MEALDEYDVIMTTGGTAISKGDVVLDVVGDIGEILFHGVSIRPGKPIGAGIANDKMIFTFSGQPVAAMTQFDIFARKYLFNMQGRDFTCCSKRIFIKNSFSAWKNRFCPCIFR